MKEKAKRSEGSRRHNNGGVKEGCYIGLRKRKMRMHQSGLDQTKNSNMAEEDGERGRVESRDVGAAPQPRSHCSEHRPRDKPVGAEHEAEEEIKNQETGKQREKTGAYGSENMPGIPLLGAEGMQLLIDESFTYKRAVIFQTSNGKDAQGKKGNERTGRPPVCQENVLVLHHTLPVFE